MPAIARASAAPLSSAAVWWLRAARAPPPRVCQPGARGAPTSHPCAEVGTQRAEPAPPPVLTPQANNATVVQQPTSTMTQRRQDKRTGAPTMTQRRQDKRTEHRTKKICSAPQPSSPAGSLRSARRGARRAALVESVPPAGALVRTPASRSARRERRANCKSPVDISTTRPAFGGRGEDADPSSQHQPQEWRRLPSFLRAHWPWVGHETHHTTRGRPRPDGCILPSRLWHLPSGIDSCLERIAKSYPW